MAALDLLSRRWLLRILWELRGGPAGFRELQSRCDQMSPDTLSTRLHELKEARLVHATPEGTWALTPMGEDLGPILIDLSRWSERWAAHLRAK